MFDSNYDLKDESETLRFAESMADHLHPGMNLYLKGELGVGKTTFVRGLLRGLGYQDKVKSKEILFSYMGPNHAWSIHVVF